jgi:hypothetical protein
MKHEESWDETLFYESVDDAVNKIDKVLRSDRLQEELR